MGVVRTPLRGYCRRRPAGGSGARRAIRLPARHAVARDRRDGGGRGAVRLRGGLGGGGGGAGQPHLAPLFTHSATALTWMMMGYGFIASVLPVWMLLCPRDYLSTFLKITTILVLAIAILVILPPLRMPALTPFASLGEGPVFAGKLFPFAFITIACGAISGFHSL